jgi:hypothetical protein
VNRIDGEWTPELQGWINDGPRPNELPDSVFDVVMERVPAIRQRHSGWPPATLPSLNLMARVGLATMVVLLAVWAGYNAPRGFDFAGPGPSASAAEDTAAAVRQTLRYWTGREMPAGTYYVDEPFPARIAFTVPDGMVAYTVLSGFAGLCASTCEPEIAGLDFWKVDGGYADACAGTALDTPIGPSVDDFVEYLQAVEGVSVGSVSDVTLAGYEGVYVETVADSDTSECDNGLMSLFFSRSDGYYYARRAAGGGVDRLWILNVEGRRLVIDVFSAPEATDAQVEDLVGVAESIRIEHVDPPSTPAD